MIKKIYLCCTALMLFCACQEPIDLKFDISDVRQLVVDGALTDSLKQHEIKLNYTSGFDSRGFFIPSPINNAQVRILDDQNNIIDLQFSENGTYLTPEMSAVEDRSYKIEIRIGEEKYESDFLGLPGGTGDLTLSYEPETRQELSVSRRVVRDRPGVRIDANLTDASPETYFVWQIEHYFIAEAFITNEYCYVRDFNIQTVKVFESSPISVSPDVQLTTEIDFVEPSYRFKHDFAVVVRQLMVDREAYDFWRKIQEQIENVGSLFDSAPTRIHGNVKNATSGERTLGYFGVFRESAGRTFFNQKELPYPVVDYECGDPQSEFCYDCLQHPGSDKQPLLSEWRRWWRCLYFGDNELEPILNKPFDECF